MNEFENQCNLQFLNHEKCCGIKKTFIEIPIVILGGYSRKFSQRQCKIQFFRDNLVDQKLRTENPKFGNHGATSGIYWVYCKLPVLSYLEVGTYVCGPFKNRIVG